MDFTLTYDILALLFLVALVASIIDTLAGGGGLITIPALILAGLPPLFALGTNKFQSFAGTITATATLIKKKKITFSEIKFLMLYAFIGSALGTIAIQFIDTKVINFIIPIVLFLIGIYFIFMPSTKTIKKEAKLSESTYKKTIVPIIGFYDGALGPGTGSFFSVSAIALRAHDLIKATALAKAMNFATNVASMIVFLFYGKIVFYVGITMMIGQVIGGFIGANFLIKINPNLLRAIVVLVCFIMLIKYVTQMGWISF